MSYRVAGLNLNMLLLSFDISLCGYVFTVKRRYRFQRMLEVGSSYF